jgi:hypothetical protein
VRPKRVFAGVWRGSLLALFGLSLVILGATIFLKPEGGEPTVAIGTLALAAATVWLGWQTRQVSKETGRLASKTGEELDLLRQQTSAMTDQAAVARQQLDELREARFAEFLPVLHWQLGQQGIEYNNTQAGLWVSARVLLTNVANSPARIKSLTFEVEGFPDERLEALGLVTPSTLPGGERIDLWMRMLRPASDYPGERIVHIDLLYADMANVRHYETTPTLKVVWTQSNPSVALLDADDLTPDERLWDENMRARWADQH